MKSKVSLKNQNVDALNQEISKLKAENDTLHKQAIKNIKDLKNIEKLKNEKESEIQIMKESSKRHNAEMDKLLSDIW